MSKHSPGSKRWWQETAMIVASGVALAVWLWDGPPFVMTFEPVPVAQIQPQAPRTMADLLDAGCLTQEHLRAMVEGRQVQVFCPSPDPPPVLLRDLPPEQRPFP